MKRIFIEKLSRIVQNGKLPIQLLANKSLSFPTTKIHKLKCRFPLVATFTQQIGRLGQIDSQELDQLT